jgi:hypothetical protein
VWEILVDFTDYWEKYMIDGTEKTWIAPDVFFEVEFVERVKGQRLVWRGK